jgi:hypothetical protein
MPAYISSYGRLECWNAADARAIRGVESRATERALTSATVIT